MRFSTIALALFASAAPALGAPWRLRDAGPGPNGVIGVLDPVADDDCGQILDANALAMKVSSQLCVSPASCPYARAHHPRSPGAPLCAPAGTSQFDLIGTHLFTYVHTWTRAELDTVNGVTVATDVAIIGHCEYCTGVNDIDVSPTLMQLITGGGVNTDQPAISAEIQVAFF
jgi:hypothetical protein